MIDRFFCFCIILFFGLNQSYSQDGNNLVSIPPSPNSSSLIDEINLPVNNYSGILSIPIQLINFSGRKISVPIGLNYHAGGIKLQEVASQVGLGWGLNAGGVITRTVRGKPDNGYFCANGDYTDRTYYPPIFHGMLNNLCDSQPDIFYFNFLGMQGRFVFDKNGIPTTIPYQNIKIEPPFGPTSTSNYWIITDPNGYRYFFGENSNFIETTISETNGKTETYASTWYLSKVMDPFGNEDVSFAYVIGTNVSYEYFAETMAKVIKQPGGSCNPDRSEEYATNTKIIIDKPKYIKTITSPLGTVEFGYSSNRKDLKGGWNVTNITQRNNLGIIKSYDFEYEYFNGANTFWGSYTVKGLPPYSFPSDCNDCFRLKLKSIKQNNLDFWKFTYEEGVDLPPRFTSFEDHWGYFNGRTGMYSVWYHRGFYSKIPGIPDQEGADKEAHFTAAKANILIEVDYPTGLKSEFIYESNEGAAGVRIKKILSKEKGVTINEKEYFYYLPVKLAQPIYAFEYNAINAGYNHSFNVGPLNLTVSSSCPVKFLRINSGSYVSLFDIDGVSVGYGKVSVIESGLIREDYYYTNYSDRPDANPEIYYDVARIGDIIPQNLPVEPNGPPFAAKSSFFWERGLLLKKELFTKVGSNYLVAQRITKEYDFDASPRKEIEGVAVMSTIQTYGSNGFAPVYHFGKYKLISKPLFLKSEVEEIYDQFEPGNEAKKTATTTSYSYIPVSGSNQSTYASDLLARKITKTLPTGEKLVSETKYPIDYITTTIAPNDVAARAIYFMKSKKMDNFPIESISYLERLENGTTKKYLLGASVSKFKEFSIGKISNWENYKLKSGIGNLFTNYNWTEVISQSFSWPNSGSFKLVNQISSYDSFGNPTTVYGEDGIQTNYVWGNNSSLLASFTRNPGSYQHQTGFTHSPLVGLTKLTDLNSRNTNYTYDNFNRLKHVKDHNNHITTQYRYHYKGQEEALSNNSISISGCPQPGQVVNFSSAVPSDFGETKYHWDFGDGNSITTTSTSTPHTYSSIGSYQVKVRRENPEYLSSDATLNITVTNPITGINILINGPTSIDLCDGFNVEYPTFFSIDPRGTASTQWDYRYNNGPWYSLGSGPGVESPPGFGPLGYSGSYTVRCTVTGTCGNTYTDSVDLIVYSSNPYCVQH